MWKKVLAFVVLVVAISALFIVASSAAGITDSVVVDIDYSNGEYFDRVGPFTSIIDGTTPTFKSASWTSGYGGPSLKSVQTSTLTTATTQKYTEYNGTVNLPNAHAVEVYTRFRQLTSGYANAFDAGSRWQIEVYPQGDGTAKIQAWYTWNNYGGNAILMSTKSYDITKFHHIVMATDGAGGYYLYIDGKLDVSVNTGYTEAAHVYYLCPGGNGDESAGKQRVGGTYIERIRMFSAAPTAAEVAEMYQSYFENTVVNVDFTTGNMTDTAGNYTFSGSKSNVDATTMNSFDVYSGAIYKTSTTIFGSGDVVLGKRFTIEYYGVLDNTTSNVEFFTSAYKLESEGGKVGAWDTILGGGAYASGACADLTKAHYFTIVGNYDTLTLYVDGVAVGSKSYKVVDRNLSSIRFFNPYLIKFKVSTYAYSATEVLNAYQATRGVRFSGASLTLTNSVDVNYKVPANIIGGNTGIATPTVTFSFGGKTYNPTKTQTVNGEYVYTFANIAPHQMNDTITATITSTNYAGQAVASTKTYSIVEYCKNQLNSNTSKSEFTTLIVDLLNYGAASQTYMNYNTDNLANSWLSATQKSWATADRAYESDKAFSRISNPSVTWKSAGLNLTSAVDMRFRIVTANISGLSVKAYVPSTGVTYTIDSFLSNGNNEYYFFFNEFNAASST